MRLGAFEIEACYATGGMGQVWRGTYPRHNVAVAIKVMTGASSLSESYHTWFRREVQATARLNHPGIVDVYDFGMLPDSVQELGLTPQSPYFVMEFIEGTSPKRVVQTWSELQHILRGILEALAHAHAHGVIHRDIKPDNVIVEKSTQGLSRVVLTDFGVAHALERNTSTYSDDVTARNSEEMSGTPVYMAPEQFCGQFRDYGPWTDLYAVGIMAWELACGVPPFQGDNPYKLARLHMNTPLPELNPIFEVPEGFFDWVKTLAAKEFTDRPSSAAEALEGLLSLAIPEDLRRTEESDAFDSSLSFDDSPTMFVPTASASKTPAIRLRTPPEDWRQAVRQAGPLRVRTGLGLMGLRTVPLTGRGPERDLLWRAFVDVWDTRMPGTVVIRGLAGTGKSRLAQWLCELTQETGHAEVFRASHQAEPGRMHGLGWMLRQRYRAAGLTGEALVERVTAVLARHGVTDDYEARALAEMMREDVARDMDAPIPTTQLLLSVDQRLELLRRELLRQTQKKVAIVWLDDGIFDREALALIEHIHRHQEDTPVLFLLTVREESLDDHPRFRSGLEVIESLDDVQALKLDFMDAVSYDTLIRAGLGVTGPAADLLIQRGDGSPLFATQLVEFWLAQGVLKEQGGLVAMTNPNIKLPQNISSLWEERVAYIVNYLAQARELDNYTFSRAVPTEVVWKRLEFAAALGRDVDEAEWQHACAMAGLENVPGLIETLVKVRLAEPSDGGLSFVHGLLRDHLREHAIRERRWKRANLTCARMLTSRYDQNFPGLASRVARHFMEGGQMPLAQMCLMEALERERASGLNTPVIEVCEMLEQVLNRSKVPKDHPLWIPVFAAHGRALVESSRTHDMARGRELLQQAMAIAEHHPPSAASVRAMASFGASFVLIHKAIRGLPFAFEAVKIAPDDETRGECLLDLAQIYQGIHDPISALENSEIALALLTHPQRRARALMLIGRALIALEHPDAEKVFDEALSLCRTHGYFMIEAQIHTLRAHLMDQRQDFVQALQCYQQALQIYRVFEPDATLALRAAEDVARAMLQLGLAEDALTALQQLERRLIAEDQRVNSDIADAMLWAAAATRNWTQFDRVFSKAFAFENGAPTTLNARALKSTVDILLQRGDHGRARQVAQNAMLTIEGIPALLGEYQWFAEISGVR